MALNNRTEARIVATFEDNLSGPASKAFGEISRASRLVQKEVLSLKGLGSEVSEKFVEGISRALPLVARETNRLGASMQSILGGAIESLKGGFKGLENFAANSLNRISNSLLQSLGNFAVQGLVSGFQSFFIPSLPPTAAGVVPQPGFLGPGFAQGGSFQVPGLGGTDSQFVGFRATPGERVTVSRPDQVGAKINVNVINNAGVQVETRQTQNGNGQIDVSVVLDQAVAKNIRSGGATLNALRDILGSRPQTIGR